MERSKCDTRNILVDVHVVEEVNVGSWLVWEQFVQYTGKCLQSNMSVSYIDDQY